MALKSVTSKNRRKKKYGNSFLGWLKLLFPASENSSIWFGTYHGMVVYDTFYSVSCPLKRTNDSSSKKRDGVDKAGFKSILGRERDETPEFRE